MNNIKDVFEIRFQHHVDELKWLYMELYDNEDMFDELCDSMRRFYRERNKDLKVLDLEREAEPDWYKKNDMLGMMFYIDNFAGNMKGVQSKLDYLEKCSVNYIHLMPFLDTVEGRSDGGYAVADFRKVQEKLGTMEDLENLTEACHQKKISVCMDFVMNHTSEDHEWAKKARQGDKEYQSRYFFFDDFSVPEIYERTVPQVFPTTAPGNFTWLPDAGKFVMTTFYPYQWDLNYRNPRVFNEMMYNFLYFANKGVDIIRIDAVPYIWKELYTQCRNLPQVHTIVRMMRMIGEIVCPGILLLGEVVMEPEKAEYERDEAALEKAVRLDITLHAYMFMQSGIPVLYSGDEIGQLNDYGYKENPYKAEDSRYIHRGAMDWNAAAGIEDSTTVQSKIFRQLCRLESIRKSEKAFMASADTWTIETWDSSVLCIGRYYEGEKILGLFNFSEYDKTAWINETDGTYVDMISGRSMKASGVNIPAYGFYYLKKENEPGGDGDETL